MPTVSNSLTPDKGFQLHFDYGCGRGNVSLFLQDCFYKVILVDSSFGMIEEVQRKIEQINEKIKSKGLKVTPQRMAVLKSVYELNNHPTADNILEYVRMENPNVAMGTIYKVLDTLIENKLIKKVTTDNGVMRYDGIMENHHYLYCVECDLIEDYNDTELDSLLKDYFKKKNIKGFKLKNFVLQINGTFDKC